MYFILVFGMLEEHNYRNSCGLGRSESASCDMVGIVGVFNYPICMYRPVK